MKSNTKSAFLGIVICLICIGSLFAQDAVQGDLSKLPKPQTESFEGADAVMATGLAAGCWNLAAELIKIMPECEDNIRNSSKFLPQAIFNADGTVWYLIGRLRTAPEGLKLAREIGLDPLVFHQTFMVLRITGESRNWYRVEVDETSRTTKYIAKTDPGFFNVSWKFYVMNTKTVEVCNSASLLDRPDGKPVHELLAKSDKIPLRLKIEDVDGNWIKVYTGFREWKKEGWIKWRDGHDMVVLGLRSERDRLFVDSNHWFPCAAAKTAVSERTESRPQPRGAADGRA